MIKYKKIILTFLLFGLSLSQFDDINITYEYNENIIRSEQVYILEEFVSMIEKYLRTTTFSYENNHLEIPIKIHFIFERIEFTGESNYNAIICQFVISNGYDQYYFVKSTSLPYYRGKTMYLNELNFDATTSFFDYFAYLFLGYELDGIDLFLGDTFYSRCIEISSMGMTSGNSGGWDSRREDIRTIKNNEFLRIARNSFYNYMELFYSENYNLAEIKELATNIIANFKSVHNKIGYDKNTLKFIQAFHKELVEIFSFHEMQEAIIFLYKYDDKNKTFYEKYLN